MASRISPAYISGFIDAVFRGGDVGAISLLGGSLYLALLTKEPYDAYDMLFFDSADEVSYTGYARRTIARTLAGFLGTQGTTAASSGTSGTTRPASNQYFPLCATSSEVVTHAALVTHSTRAVVENEVLCYWTLPRPMALSASTPGYYPCLHAAGLTISVDN